MKKTHKSNTSKKITNKRDVIVKIITIIAIIVVIAVVSNFINNLETINIKTEKHEFFDFFAGERITYNGSLKLTRKNDITELITDDGPVILDSTPIYYCDKKDKVLLPSTMSITFPLDSGASYKINSFTTMYLENGDVHIEKGLLNKIVKDAFLFDGESVYFFIDRATLSVNGNEYVLAPLSYVNATYGGYIEIYNAETDEFVYLDSVEGEIIAKTSRYEINLNLDLVKYGGTEKLLTRKIKGLNNFE